MGTNPLIGAWRLVAYEGHTGDNVLYPLGEDAAGYIMYTHDGYMSVSMMAAGRTNFAGGDMFAGTDEEKIAAAGSYVSYCGKYEYLGDRVIHKIEAAFFPNRVGTEQTRFVHLEGDTLTLTTPPMVLAGETRKGRIVWQRAEMASAWEPGSPRQVEAARLRDDVGLSYREIGIRLGGISRQRAEQLVRGGRRFRQPTASVE